MRNIFIVIAVLVLSTNVKADEGVNDLENSTTASSAPAAASTPHELTLLEKVAKLEKGKTTYNDAVNELGKPYSATTNGEGIKTAIYIDSTANIMGVLSGVGKQRNIRANASLFFDKNDILVWMTTTQY